MSRLFDKTLSDQVTAALLAAGRMSSAIDRFSRGSYSSTHDRRPPVVSEGNAGAAWTDLLAAKRDYDRSVVTIQQLMDSEEANEKNDR